MARGRARKLGERYPSGKLKPEKSHAAMYWQRERDALRTTARHADLGSALGILFRQDRITATHMEAGNRFAQQRQAADAALSLPPRNARAQDVTRVQGLPVDADTEEAVRRSSRAIDAYAAAEEAIGLGSRALVAVQWVVVYDRWPDDYAQTLALIEGLGKLSVHYGLARAA